MDELIALAVRRLAEKSAPSGQPAEAAAERYQQILEALRARAVAPPEAVPSAAGGQPQTAPVPPPRPSPPPSPPPSQPPPHRQEHGPLQGLFEGGNSLVRAVVAAELLDRPLALRENAYWQKR